MAVAGLLVQTAPGRQSAALGRIRDMAGVSETGRPSDSFFTAVAEVPGHALDGLLGSIRAARDVLCVYVNYVHLADD